MSTCLQGSVLLVGWGEEGGVGRMGPASGGHEPRNFATAAQTNKNVLRRHREHIGRQGNQDNLNSSWCPKTIVKLLGLVSVYVL